MPTGTERAGAGMSNEANSARPGPGNSKSQALNPKPIQSPKDEHRNVKQTQFDGRVAPNEPNFSLFGAENESRAEKQSQSGQLRIADRGFGAAGSRRCQTNPIGAGHRQAGRLPLPPVGAGAGVSNEANFARRSAGGWGPSAAKRSQFAFFWGRNGGMACETKPISRPAAVWANAAG